MRTHALKDTDTETDTHIRTHRHRQRHRHRHRHRHKHRHGHTQAQAQTHRHTHTRARTCWRCCFRSFRRLCACGGRIAAATATNLLLLINARHAAGQTGARGAGWSSGCEWMSCVKTALFGKERAQEKTVHVHRISPRKNICNSRLALVFLVVTACTTTTTTTAAAAAAPPCARDSTSGPRLAQTLRAAQPAPAR